MPNQRILGTAVTLSHLFIKQTLQPGETVVDATAGNGHDTLFLAQQVGVSGRVYAFDIQETALTKTRQRLQQAGADFQTSLIQDGHQRLEHYVQGPVGAIMFNLGYLPGGSQELITKAETTILALQTGLKLLRPRGLISLVVYSGHPGGEEEATALEQYLQSLDQTSFSVLRMDFSNRKNNSPYLVLIEREN